MKIAFSTLFIGLDNSGKTTMIQSLKSNPGEQEIMPTAGYAIEKINYPKLSKPILIFDCSGQGRHRENWITFYPDTDSIVFVIDSSDTKRLHLIKSYVEQLITDPGCFFVFY